MSRNQPAKISKAAIAAMSDEELRELSYSSEYRYLSSMMQNFIAAEFVKRAAR